MANVAILIGNSHYNALSALDCCDEDVKAIKELLDATGKFDDIDVVLNVDSAKLKGHIRALVNNHDSIGELFFYFTGHGFQREDEFYFCATDFNVKRPNETGLSNTELHTLLKVANAELVTKVVDACYSGVLLVKADGSFLPTGGNGFKHLIQIAACLDSQNSLTGDPLSIFTEKFRVAALRKLDGPIYYSDIVNVLRDEFLNNNTQTPHFVLQGTGREEFVENAKHLDGLRTKITVMQSDAVMVENVPSLADQPIMNVLDILQKAETTFAKKETAQAFISGLFQKLTRAAASADFFEQLFNAEAVEHSEFEEPTTRVFIIRVLANEKRPDNFVTATVKREYKRRDPFNLSWAAMGASSLFGGSEEVINHYDLNVNCTLGKVQLKITLTPKFVTLKRFVLVVSCAPSLEVCYVMEMLTQHPLMDWGVFSEEGIEVVRRWYKMKWTDLCDFVVAKIFDKLRCAVKESVDAATQAVLQK